MKIGIDARICGTHGYYSLFIEELIAALMKENTQHEIIVYTDKNLTLKRNSLLDNTKAKKIFEKENFALMIFFDSALPHGYKGDYFLILESLKEVFFPKKQWLHRHIFQWRLTKAIE